MMEFNTINNNTFGCGSDPRGSEQHITNNMPRSVYVSVCVCVCVCVCLGVIKQHVALVV
jgi:hypothetical protein